MDGFLQIAFWLLAVLSVYSYALYPLLLRLIPPRNASPEANAGSTTPPITVIVTAHNEEQRIRTKLEELVELPAYRGGTEILVASDASTDATDEIVREFADRGVRLVRNDAHDGKEAAQGLAIAEASGKILVFTDVSTSMRGDVLTAIAAHFVTPDVGALSSTDRFIDRDGRPSGEGAYVRYEMWLRGLEMRVSSLIGLSGSFFAARSEICRKDWSTTIPSDFVTALNCFRRGYVAIQAADVVGYYRDLAESGNEFGRKVRTVLRGMRALREVPAVLNPFRYGLFAFQVWSHKVMRWLTPWFLLALFLATLPLVRVHAVYWLALTAQVAFYGLAIVGWIQERATVFAVVRIPYYFVLANAAVARAGVDFLRGSTALTWTPSAR